MGNRCSGCYSNGCFYQQISEAARNDVVKSHFQEKIKNIHLPF